MNKNNPYTHIGAARQAYIDVRPQYPESLIDSLEINSDSTVLDVGAGTGKLTAQLYSRTKKIWALEPAAEFAKAFFQVLPYFPREKFITAIAEETTLPRRIFDCITYGQCWHWLDAPAASREAARILRPHGKIGIFYNQLDVSVPWVLQLTRIMRSGDVQKIAKPPQLTRDFFKPQLNLETWTDELTVEEILQLGTTRTSWLKSSLENRQKMQNNLRFYLYDELGYGPGDLVKLPYQTQLWTAEKRY